MHQVYFVAIGDTKILTELNMILFTYWKEYLSSQIYSFLQTYECPKFQNQWFSTDPLCIARYPDYSLSILEYIFHSPAKKKIKVSIFFPAFHNIQH